MSLTEKNLEQKVSDYLKTLDNINHSTIVVALSGGPDSTALLIALHNIKDNFNFHLKAAYINHGMRNHDDLNGDDLFVEKLTNKLNVELFKKKIAFGQIIKTSDNEGRSSEEIARSIRYSFFNIVLKKYKNPYLATGHNLDDQFETMIIRFFQGSGLGGLKGIPQNNKFIIRPLLNCQKNEIISYCKEKNISFRTDPSNNENNYQRNKVRNILIPEIKKIFPGYKTSLLALEKKFKDLNSYFENKMENLECHYSENKCSVQIDLFNKTEKITRQKLLYNMFDYVYCGKEQSFRVPERFFNNILDRDLKNNKTYASAYGIKICTKSNKLHFLQELKKTGFYYLYNNTPINNKWFSINFVNKSQIIIKKIDNSPLIIRSRIDGDSIFTDNKNKTVKSFFSKWDVPEEIRDLIPIVEDSEGIISILGEKFGFKNVYRNKNNNTSKKFNILYLEVLRRK